MVVKITEFRENLGISVRKNLKYLDKIMSINLEDLTREVEAREKFATLFLKEGHEYGFSFYKESIRYTVAFGPLKTKADIYLGECSNNRIKTFEGEEVARLYDEIVNKFKPRLKESLISDGFLAEDLEKNLGF